MERVKLSEKLEFSRLIYGMWRLADDVDTSVSHVETKINKCLEQGITTFDQADIYGGYTAEAVLGQALKKNQPYVIKWKLSQNVISLLMPEDTRSQSQTL